MFHRWRTGATCAKFCCSSGVRLIASSRRAGAKRRGLEVLGSPLLAVGRAGLRALGSPLLAVRRAGLRVLPWLLLAGLASVPAPALAASPRTPTLAPSSTVIDGPSADIQSLSGLAVARDGTGGAAYLKNVNGVAHVFVSRLLGGHFGAAQQVDTGLGLPSSQPVIAAANPGQLVVGFINGGTLYVVQSLGAFSPLSAPGPLAAGARNPALSMATSGKAYLAFTATGSGGGDVRAAYYNQGQWALEPSPLDANPSDNAGTGTGRPAVAASGDGVAIVAWGENGHIFTRRVWGVSPSVVFQQADPGSLGGVGEVSAGSPAIGTGGDSSYAAVVFQETFSNGSATQSRVLMNRLRAGNYDGIAPVDGGSVLGPEGADQPQLVITEFGRGWVVSEGDHSHNITGSPLATNESPTVSQRINSQVLSAAPDAVAGVAGTVSTMIAWQQVPGSQGPAEIRLRYAPNGSDLNPEQVISTAGLGPTNAGKGLAVTGDLSGDTVASWVQGTGAGTQIVAGQLYQTPGSFVPLQAFRYADSLNPILSWSTASELWGPLNYVVTFDGAPVGQTGGTSARVLTPIGQGPHTWQVTAVNQAGLSTVARAGTVFVDTIKPQVSFKLTGSPTVGSTVRIAIKDNDAPRPLPRSQSSGIKSVQVKWGDGAKPFLKKTSATHVYKRRRSYVVTVIVKDRASNRTVVTRKLTIKPKSRPKNKKGKGKPKAKKAGTSHLARVTQATFSPGGLIGALQSAAAPTRTGGSRR
jgi:hypothetical protein